MNRISDTGFATEDTQKRIRFHLAEWPAIDLERLTELVGVARESISGELARMIREGEVELIRPIALPRSDLRMVRVLGEPAGEDGTYYRLVREASDDVRREEHSPVRSRFTMRRRAWFRKIGDVVSNIGGKSMMRSAGMGVLAAMCMGVFGCGNGDSPAPTPTLVGQSGSTAQWTLSIQSVDGAIVLNGTAMAITEIGVGSYAVAWMSGTPNGTATLDLGTRVVQIQVSGGQQALNLFGDLLNNNSMSGSGTLTGFGAVHEVHWSANR